MLTQYVVAQHRGIAQLESWQFRGSLSFQIYCWQGLIYHLHSFFLIITYMLVLREPKFSRACLYEHWYVQSHFC